MSAIAKQPLLAGPKPFISSQVVIAPSVRPAVLIASHSHSRCSLLASTSSIIAQPLAYRSAGQPRCTVVRASSDEKPVVYNKEFGYSRKDVLLIGAGLIALGYALYYGLQAAGMEAGMAGNWVQLIIFLGICIGWVSTYVYRVATKQMTYVRQLEQYEEAVMQKRLEEMTESELADLAAEVEKEKRK